MATCSFSRPRDGDVLPRRPRGWRRPPSPARAGEGWGEDEWQRRLIADPPSGRAADRLRRTRCLAYGARLLRRALELCRDEAEYLCVAKQCVVPDAGELDVRRTRET